MKKVSKAKNIRTAILSKEINLINVLDIFRIRQMRFYQAAQRQGNRILLTVLPLTLLQLSLIPAER